MFWFLPFPYFCRHMFTSICKMKKMKVLVVQPCLTLCNPRDCSLPWLLCQWNSPGKKTGDSSHFLLQGIFLTQGPNPGLLPSEPPGKLCVRSFLSFSLPSSFHSTKKQYVGSIFSSYCYDFLSFPVFSDKHLRPSMTW